MSLIIEANTEEDYNAAKVNLHHKNRVDTQ